MEADGGKKRGKGKGRKFYQKTFWTGVLGGGGDLDFGTCLACIWSMKAYAMAFQTTFDSNKKIVLKILNIIMMLKSLFGQDS